MLEGGLKLGAESTLAGNTKAGSSRLVPLGFCLNNRTSESRIVATLGLSDSVFNGSLIIIGTGELVETALVGADTESFTTTGVTPDSGLFSGSATAADGKETCTTAAFVSPAIVAVISEMGGNTATATAGPDERNRTGDGPIAGK